MLQKKIVICGSVDDGKSTLTGRIYYETGNIKKDILDKIKNISKKKDNSLDLTFFSDGLEDEIQQGITIDVSHKYLDYKKQRFIFHDSPGHNQYTRNVVTAASNCKIAIVLIDASKGVLDQTKRHVQILNFLNINNILFVINKIDLINFNKTKYFKILNYLKNFISNFNIEHPHFIPVSALQGINVTKPTTKSVWYKSKSVLEILNDIKIKKTNYKNYFSVQFVKKKENKRIYYGNLSGGISKNKKILILPSKQKTEISQIYNDFRSVNSIKGNTYLSIETKSHLDIVKGDIFSWGDLNNFDKGSKFNSTVVITSAEGIIKGREYILRIDNQETNILITNIKGCLDFENKLIKKNKLEINDFGEIEFTSQKIMLFASTKKSQLKDFNNFILIDSISNNVLAAGKLNFKLKRDDKIFPIKTKINKNLRAGIKNQKPFCIWLTGRSSSGKSTLASALEAKLFNLGFHTYILDGDNLRTGLNIDLGFKESDRIENIRRIAEVSKLFVDSGIIVLVASISPYSKEREFAKSLFLEKEFFEVFVNTPLNICIKRDKKGLYKNITKNKKSLNTIGLTGVYEEPKNPFFIANMENESSTKVAERLLNLVIKATSNFKNN